MALPPDWRVRRDRHHRRMLVLVWSVFGLWLVVTFFVAIHPLVDPAMPQVGRLKILAALPLSYRLLSGGWYAWLLFAALWLVPAGVPLFLVVMSRVGRERERRRRRLRDRERRAQKRGGRLAAQSSPPVTEGGG
ncbi:hypothetical protein [Sphingomonas sp.]|uniref:hypothetical protein n=1 Tax=Sphingomonas sp. TaxID=28214 RepID=UPI001ED6CA3E|nr:hypothetical protein [Sphingomonas sp.]MBX3594772.1 hypothetical protein [Sphingomonas sp.]